MYSYHIQGRDFIIPIVQNYKLELTGITQQFDSRLESELRSDCTVVLY